MRWMTAAAMVVAAAGPGAAQTTGGRFAAEAKPLVLYKHNLADRPHLLTVCVTTGRVTLLMGTPAGWMGVATMTAGQCYSTSWPLKIGQMIAVDPSQKSDGTYALTLLGAGT